MDGDITFIGNILSRERMTEHGQTNKTAFDAGWKETAAATAAEQ